MAIWKTEGVNLEILNQFNNNTLMETLEIHFNEIGDDFLSATMPVTPKCHQPLGLLHGGASVVLAETLGSTAANLCLNHLEEYAVGLEINANHVKAVRSGLVTGTAKPLHIGNTTQIWEIKIVNEKNQLVCISRITMAVIKKEIRLG